MGYIICSQCWMFYKLQMCTQEKNNDIFIHCRYQCWFFAKMYSIQDKCKESDDNDDESWKSTKLGNTLVVVCTADL